MYNFQLEKEEIICNLSEKGVVKDDFDFIFICTTILQQHIYLHLFNSIPNI